MNKKPDIIQVVSYYPPHLGGMENCAQQISKLLSKTFKVNVFTSDIGKTKRISISGNPNVSYLK